MPALSNIVLIPKNRLLLIAGLVWCVAGGMVSFIGLPLLWRLGAGQPLLYPSAMLIFLIFYRRIFSRLVVKHTQRIRMSAASTMPFWSFFDRSSYIVMSIMIAGGMWLRLGHIAADWMIAFFYSGLGLALFSCGVKFILGFLRMDVDQ